MSFSSERLVRAAPFNKGSVYIHFTHVIYYDSYFTSFTIVKDVVEQSGFPAPRKPDKTVTGRFFLFFP